MSASPFETTTTPLIERANRLIALRAHPGFLDLIRLSQEMVDEAIASTSDYPGWDAQQITVLKVRQQAAKEHHKRLFGKINEAIAAGIEDGVANLSNLPEKTAVEMMEQGDFVRQKVLQRFDQMDEDLRAAGSYAPNE